MVDSGRHWIANFGPAPVPFYRNATLSGAPPFTCLPCYLTLTYQFNGSKPIGTYFSSAPLVVPGSEPMIRPIGPEWRPNPSSLSPRPFNRAAVIPCNCYKKVTVENRVPRDTEWASRTYHQKLAGRETESDKEA